MTTSTASPREGEVLWTPSEQTMHSCRMADYAHGLSDRNGVTFTDYQQLWQWSTHDLAGFWRSVWDYFDVLADGDPSRVLTDRAMPGARWFPDVRLNYAENMLRGDADQTVLTALSQTRATSTLTRGELRDQVARAAAGLRRLGVGRGDRVAAYLPNIPETLVAMLATTSIGAIWAVCAPELGVTSVLDRLAQLEPTVLIAVDGYRYGAKAIDRHADVATIAAGLPTLTATVHVPYLGSATTAGLEWAELLSEPAALRYDRVPFDHPLWVLFSSGTTGLPKAIVHSHGGIVLELQKALALHSDLGPLDTYFVYCTTTWVMWNIQVSALLLGSSIVMFDGDPAFRGPDELWRVVADNSVTVFGAGAAFLMACRKSGLRPKESFDLSRLRGVVSTGSPLPADGFRWIYDAVGSDIYLQSTSGGTDVCTSFVGGTPLLPVRAGEITAPALGVAAQALDSEGQPVVGQVGELVISEPMPSMPVCFWNDADGRKYRAAYFEKYPGQWRHGDWVTFNSRGACVISGRSDGTLNRGGVRLGTSEFYSALQDLDDVEDSLVVHLDDPSGGMGRLVLFLVLRVGASLDEGLRSRIASRLRQRLSPRHAPDDVVVVAEIPYNLTGKKLEVPVKRLLLGEPRDTVVSDGAVRNPRALDIFEQLAGNYTPARS
ncbi:acetoacetate--CoA ligase [Mycobacterium sp. CVI_P3]|uniref:Acetoacetate--CoA ligase n=1 Tax=Mycobacterium pinniadriaticum TaxID=2994102 RepID=A0ABT3SA73_9MYCO|nr:acetoacetate--CoA ligase [Mycobacterium pinniadriaticum]MCX2929927.1 acetoacetate--CoA ligase [Mycobacterium pinniadriaticum]MCX2936424.1 acetoacetate--CoA ligase [Mycobacterium pinniadriaticum]